MKRNLWTVVGKTKLEPMGWSSKKNTKLRKVASVSEQQQQNIINNIVLCSGMNLSLHTINICRVFGCGLTFDLSYDPYEMASPQLP